MAKITKKLDHFDFLSFPISSCLKLLLIDVFDNKPDVWDVLINPDIQVKYLCENRWKITVLVQVIWAKNNAWVKPFKFDISMDVEGNLLCTHFWHEDFPARDRLRPLVKQSNRWIEDDYNKF
jgi:hypothetical protein